MIDWILSLPAKLIALVISVATLIVLVIMLLAVLRYSEANPDTFSGWADVIVGQIMRFINWVIRQIGRIG